MQLVVALPDQDQFTDAVGRWTLLDAAGALLRKGEGPAGDMPFAERIIAVAPVSRVVFIETALPPVGDAKRDALLRYAIEDRLTIDPATVHAAVLGRAQGGATPLPYIVAAVDRAWLRRALAWLAAAGRTPRMVVTATESIEVRPDTWRILLEGEHGVAKRADGFAYSFDLDNPGAPPFALTLALHEAGKQGNAPAAIDISAQGELAAQVASWQAALGVPLRITAAVSEESRAAWLSRLKTNASANLLQGEFSAGGEHQVWLRTLRPAMIALALIAAAQWLLTVADWWRLERERLETQAASEQIFRTAFPQARTIVDAPLQMQRNVDALRRERGLVDTDPVRRQLARLAELAAADPGVKIKEVEIDSRAARLRAEAAGADAATALRNRVLRAGGELDAGGADSPIVSVRLKASP